MMSRMSETEPLGVAALSIGELRAALLRQRATNTQLRTVIGTQAELHQAELAAKDAADQTELAKRDAALAAKDAQIAQLQAQAANLTVANHVPVGRAAGLLGGMLGVEVSVGFVAGVRGKAAGRLGPFLERVRELLRQAEVVHADETPGRADGKVAYVHVTCTEFLTHLHVGGRAATDIDAGGVLVGYAGTIVRDGYAGYAHLAEALHAWCGAHSLRDLRAVWEADPQGQAWAGSMADL